MIGYEFSILIVIAAVSIGLISHVHNSVLLEFQVFAVLKLNDSQLSPRGGLTSSNLSTADPSQLPQPSPPRIAPDDDCLFNPALSNCAPIAGKCPAGFLLNEEEQCFPDKPCPPGFSKHDEDETGKCYPVNPEAPATTTNRTNISSLANSANSAMNQSGQ